MDRPRPPLVLGHRGACAFRPEHTLASYAKAIADGADFIEPDLVVTRDGVLVARHENNIADTTDVADRREFDARRVIKKIDGKGVEGWFTEDFTFAELKTLRARERLDAALRPQSHSYDGDFQIPSLDEIVDFVAAEVATGGRRVGLIPELKHSTYFASIGLPLEERFLAALWPPRKTLSDMRVIVQSFEIGNLRRLRSLLGGDPNFQLMQLTEGEEIPADRASAGDMRDWAERLKSRAGLAEIAEYADWIAPYARDLIPRGPDDRLMSSTGLIERAHEAGLLVCAWTFRPENTFLPRDFRNGAGDNARNPEGGIAEMRRYIEAGVDAFFTDDPALGRRAVDERIRAPVAPR
ncbi:MAG: glycerophosphodiester phosphodiesterase family protein [Methylocystis sp.]